jgi:hypothetical protein
MANLREQADLSESIALPTPAEPDRVCIRCDALKPAAAFHLVAPGKRRAQCGKCRAVTRGSRQGERKSPQKRHHRRRYTLKVYGITEEQYNAMLAAQKNVCAICGGPPRRKRRLAVDHCHATGRVRALLCDPCNLKLGNYETLRGSAEGYLAQYGAGNPLLGYEPSR